MRGARGTLAISIVAGPGCGALCNGPGCEDSFPAARLSVLRGVAGAAEELDVWADADARFDGALEEGASWTASGFEAQVVIGQPDASRVVRVDDRITAGPFAPETEWTGAGTAFGTSVLAVPARTGGFDLVVGAPGYDYGKGAVYVFRGAHEGPGREASAADVTLTSASASDRFGDRLHLCADLTGDARPEIAVTSPWFAQPPDWDVAPGEPVPTLAGAVFLLFSEALADAPAGEVRPWQMGRVWWGTDAGEGAGHAIACDRDLDGDGLVDVVVGSPWADESRGRIYALSGDPLPTSGPLDTVAWATIDGTAGGEWFGISLATLRLEEPIAEPVLAVGGAGYEDGAGRVLLYAGSDLSIQTVPRRVATFEAPADRTLPDHFGRWVYAGDVDGDLREDLLVGAPDFHGDGRNAFDTGRVWIWLGAGSAAFTIGTPAEEADHLLVGTAPFQRIGRALAVVDLDQDGTDDLLVPTRASDPGDER